MPIPFAVSVLQRLTATTLFRLGSQPRGGAQCISQSLPDVPSQISASIMEIIFFVFADCPLPLRSGIDTSFAGSSRFDFQTEKSS
jgi:hypothetical protein